MVKKEEKFETDFHKQIRRLLSENGYANASDESIAFMVDNVSDDVCIDCNFMSTGIHMKRNEISPSEIVSSGFKYCATWHANL